MIKIKISILLAFSLVKQEEGKSKKRKSKKGKSKRGKSKKGKKDKSSKSSKVKNKKKDKSSKGSKGKKSSKRGKRSKKEVVEVVVVKPKYLIEVGNPVGFSHIEYELIPGRPKYQIDVVCWGPVAKVFSADGEITLKTFVQDERAWVPLTISHVLNQLDTPELAKLHSHVIIYTIWTSKNKLGKRAKSENTKAFFIREEDVDSNVKFTEAYSTDPNLKKCEDDPLKDLKKEIKNILWECADKPDMKNYSEIVTRLEFLTDSVHHYQVNKIIDTVKSGKTFECKDFVPICPPPSTDEDLVKQTVFKKPKKKGKKGKTDKASKTSKRSSKKNKALNAKKYKASTKSKKSAKGRKSRKGRKGDGTLKITIPGEVFYTDPFLNIYDLKTPSTDITHAFVLTTTKNLMKRSQKYALNPLIIKVKKLSNLPAAVLADHRFTSVYAYYNIPYIARCSTIEKPLGKVIKFNEAHAHFTDVVPKLKLLEFMQTQRLYIEIRGVRNEYKPPPEPNIFGIETKDNEVSARLPARDCTTILESTEEPSVVTVAVACFDISSLLKPTWDFSEKTSLHHPQNLGFQKANTMYERFESIDVQTINEVNLPILQKPKCWSPLSENLLTDFGTTLKVEVHLCAPFAGILEVQSNPSRYYQRLFVVINREELATTLLNEIMMYNQYVLGPEIFIVNFLKGRRSIPDRTIKRDRSIEILDSVTSSLAVTGFVLDNGNSFAFFVEGLANGFVTHVWNQVRESRQVTTRVFYNSDFCFEQRLYGEFIKLGGLFPICLKFPLEQILSNEKIYLEGNVPLPCFEALKKLHVLLKCSTLRSMMQYCLFPTPKQLRSLGFEFGVAFKWKSDGMPFGFEESSDKSDIQDGPLVETHLNLS